MCTRRSSRLAPEGRARRSTSATGATSPPARQVRASRQGAWGLAKQRLSAKLSSHNAPLRPSVECAVPRPGRSGGCRALRGRAVASEPEDVLANFQRLDAWRSLSTRRLRREGATARAAHRGPLVWLFLVSGTPRRTGLLPSSYRLHAPQERIFARPGFPPRAAGLPSAEADIDTAPVLREDLDDVPVSLQHARDDQGVRPGAVARRTSPTNWHCPTPSISSG